MSEDVALGTPKAWDNLNMSFGNLERECVLFFFRQPQSI